MVGNTMPAINDITVTELIAVVEDIARFCPTIKVGCLSSLSCSFQFPKRKHEHLGIYMYVLEYVCVYNGWQQSTGLASYDKALQGARLMLLSKAW